MPSSADATNILDARDISRALRRMATEVLLLAGGTEQLVLIGIQRRGVELAERIGALIKEQKKAEIPIGACPGVAFGACARPASKWRRGCSRKNAGSTIVVSCRFTSSAAPS